MYFTDCSQLVFNIINRYLLLPAVHCRVITLIDLLYRAGGLEESVKKERRLQTEDGRVLNVNEAGYVTSITQR